MAAEKYVLDYLKDLNSSDFIVGVDKFENLKINHIEESNGFHFFKDNSKPISRFVRRFVLKKGKLSEKVCLITLIKNKNGKFEPRFEFQIIDLASKALLSTKIPVIEPEDRLIKSRVNFDDCHKTFSQLLTFLDGCDEIEYSGKQYTLITNDQKKILDEAIEDADKNELLQALADKYGRDITEKDIVVITKRKEALGRFKKILEQPSYFKKYQIWLREKGLSNRPEDVWQHFFENNSWIFGYGLQLVSCEKLDSKKLETIVVGADLFDGSGKRVDGLLKTKGAINRSLFTEIKRHDIKLLETYDRPGVWSPSKDLRGGVAQMQKSLHKVSLKVSRNFQQIKDKDGNPTGENIAFVKPKGVVIAGMLGEFSTDVGFNDEKFASFELYRQQISGIDILTYDELYERACFIIDAI